VGRGRCAHRGGGDTGSLTGTDLAERRFPGDVNGLRAGLPSRAGDRLVAVQVAPQTAEELLVAAVVVFDRVVELTGG